MTVRESLIERSVCDYAKNKSCLSFKFNSASQRGVPDRIFITEKGVFFVEFKRKGHLPTPLQAHVFSKFKEKNQEVYLIDDIETGKVFIDGITS